LTPYNGFLTLKKVSTVRLKSLEIKGFKSFADKTVLNFDEGITGIIGPNGCGKSNIVDSIRWVIGEHKISNLRSENLEALVFNGSKSRSASGLAEVSLTFENTRNLLPTEFSTVTITRKFYKSGESEYRLNDVQCRLKDIHNLFLDTGVSTDSYAIIELGMVDDIIKDKDNSRRKMLEQAAGISIYKTRKKEAKLKLDAAEQDLARIEDLLFEINNQLKQLESQAKKAEKYFEIKEEYKIMSVELAKAALEGFNITYKELNEKTEAESDRRHQLEAMIATEEAGLEQERLGMIDKERSLQNVQAAFNEMMGNLRLKENDKNLAQQRLVYLRERETNLNEFLGKADSQLKMLEENIGHSENQIAAEQGRLDELTNSFDSLRDNMEAKRKLFDDQRSNIDMVRKESQALQRHQFDAEKTVAVADTGILNLQRSIHQIKDEQTNRQGQLKQLEAEKTEKDVELKDKQYELEQLQTHHEQTKENILQTQQVLEGLRNNLNDENRKLDSKRNEHDLLKSLIDSMEGYPDSVKFLHNNPNWQVHAPILSDIIYVKEEYRTALENVLEPYLNYYVVQNMSEGLQAIHLLDENKKGKANFFLMEKFEQHAVDLHAPLQDAVPALNVIEVDAKYRKLAEHLLGNVFIADNEAAMTNSNGSIVLEKTGKYVKGKYSLTGGSIGLFEGKKIGRAKNLEKMQEEIAAQDIVVNELKQVIAQRHAEVISFNEQLRDNAIKETQQAINQLTNQVFALQNKIENLHVMETNAVQRLENLDNQLQENIDAIADKKDELEKLNMQLQDIADKLQLIEQDYSAAEQAYNESSYIYNNANLELTKQQSKVVGLEQELSFKRNQLTDLQAQIENNKIQLQDTASSIEENNLVFGEIENALLALMIQKETEEKQLNEADQLYYNLRNELQAKESELRHKVKEKENIEHLLGELKDRLNELKLQLAGMKERLSVEFKVDLDAILDEERTTDIPLDDLQAQVERMKKRMENMGEVNPTAIEAYTEMKKRYEFIVEQRNDLVNAKDSLMQTIAEVELTANQKFLDTFNAVKENFIKVFKALFTDQDECDMVLENPEDLANTGIDILAKPKGKRPSSITQLSGGEKTLTATALLFAIYLIKPAPFCILDEVDAPLDDANVGKFTQMIQKFSENSQFIIVTHNKMTMSAVDVVYGVTMQEAGVSKLVPVDFRSLSN
jgi:chromosome segregation protein